MVSQTTVLDYGWNRAAHTPLGKEVLAAHASSSAWKPLKGGHVIPFPLEALPNVGRDMARAVADSVQVSPDMTACFLLGSISSATVGKLSVRVNPDWVEPSHIYLIVSGDPSMRKTPAMSPFFEPLAQWVRDENQRRAPLVDDYQTQKRLLEKRLEKVIGGKHPDETEAKRLSECLRTLGATAARMLVPYLSDCTAEAIARAMRDNGGALAVRSDEAGLLQTLAGTYTENPNVDIIMQAYSSTSPVVVERVSRERIILDRPKLSITIAGQPNVVDRFINNQTMLDKGVCARFLYSQPPSIEATISALDVNRIPEVVRGAYAERMRALCAAGERVVALGGDAGAAFRAWEQEINRRGRSQTGDLFGLLNGWAGKLLGSTCRIAGLIAALSGEDTISGRTFEGAVSIARYFVEQVLPLCGGDLTSDARRGLKTISSYCRKQERRTLTSADIERRITMNLSNKHYRCRIDDARRILSELVTAGYLRKTPTINGVYTAGGAYEVHPDILLDKNGEVEQI
jgi:hypothetical protein